jgi:hypothetical protein
MELIKLWWIESIGWVGLIGLMICYVLYYFKKRRLFLLINIISSGLLTIYAGLIGSIHFIIVNGFIFIVNIINYINKKYKY